MIARTQAAVVLIVAGTTAAGAQTAAPGGAFDAGQPAAPGTQSQDTGLPAGEPASPGADLHLSFTPYLWATSFSGNIGVAGVQVDVSKSFVEVLEDSDKVFGLMGALDFEYRGFVCQLNTAWATVEERKQKGVFQNGSVEADVNVEGAFSELFAGYRFVDTPLRKADDPGRFKLDGFAGGRVTSVDVETTMYASSNITLPDGEVLGPGQSTKRTQSGDWFEPFIGLRGIVDLDKHWTLQLRGDVGGFGVEGSKFAWQTAAVLGYQWQLDGWSISVIGGYRALGQDYSSGDFSWDVVTHGPMLGVSFAWSF